MWLLNLTKSDRPEKRLKAVFCKCEKKNACKGSNHKTIHFGLKGGSTYIDHKDEKKRSAYIARHKVNENFNDPDTAGALARWILWGPYTTLSKNIQYFKNKFNL
jgi:hypothetical protein